MRCTLNQLASSVFLHDFLLLTPDLPLEEFGGMGSEGNSSFHPHATYRVLHSYEYSSPGRLLLLESELVIGDLGQPLE